LKVNAFVQCEFSGIHSGVIEDSCHVGCDA